MPPTATDLTAILGTVKQQVESYNAERQQLSSSLREIIGQANRLLSQLGEDVEAPTGVRRRGRPAGGGRKRGKPAEAAKGSLKGAKKRTRKPMTAAQKKAVGLRMKKYWAERRKAEGKQ